MRTGRQTAVSDIQRFRILGDVGAPVFGAWIARHARRLGVRSVLVSQTAACVELVVSGPPDLLDALALGCSLGPQAVLVDRLERQAGSLRDLDKAASACD